MSAEDESTFERTVFNLQILGKISEQDRLYFNNNRFDVSGPSKLDCIYRFFHSESRRQNIENVKDILATAIVLIDSLLHKEESFRIKDNKHDFSRIQQLEYARTLQKIVRLEKALEAARKGLQNWGKTYIDDTKTVQMIENIISNLDDDMTQLTFSKKLIAEKTPKNSVCQECNSEMPL